MPIGGERVKGASSRSTTGERSGLPDCCGLGVAVETVEWISFDAIADRILSGVVGFPGGGLLLLADGCLGRNPGNTSLALAIDIVSERLSRSSKSKRVV